MTEREIVFQWLKLKELEDLDTPQYFSYDEWCEKCLDKDSLRYFDNNNLGDIPSLKLMKYVKKYQKEKKTKYYYYMITFSLSDECLHGLKGDQYAEKIDKIEKFIYSQAKRVALRIKEAEIRKEYTEKGIEHWHMTVCSLKYLAKSRFNYYEKHYGFVDVSKSTIKSNDESLNYINKHGKSTILVSNFVCVV